MYRAHYYLQELFVDPSQIALLANPGGAFPQPGYEQQHAYAMQQGAGGGGGGFAMQAGGPVVGAPLPLPSLTSLGVQAETVRQLRYITLAHLSLNGCQAILSPSAIPLSLVLCRLPSPFPLPTARYRSLTLSSSLPPSPCYAVR